MKDVCVKAVSDAAGRSLKAQEVNSIADRITDAMRALARSSRDQWVGMSASERLQAAAKLAGDTIKNQAIRAKAIVGLKIKAYDRIENFTNEQLKNIKNSGLDALDRYLAINTDGRTTGRSMESQGNVIRDEARAQLVAQMEVSNRRLFGLFDNAEGVRALMHEIFGQDSKKIEGITPEMATMAKDGAAAWKKVTEGMREQYNRLGGDIGDLGDNWHLPQNHSPTRVFKAGIDKWINDQMGWIDRRQYVNEDGNLMGDDQVKGVLKQVWDTVSTRGALQNEPGSFKGNGMLANKYSDARAMHYKDADSYLANSKSYGGSTPYDTMLSHIESLGKTTAGLEYFGPNAAHMFNLWVDKMSQRDIVSDRGNTDAILARAQDMRKKFDWMSGKTQDPINKWMAIAADTTKDILTAAKLGMAPLTAANHQATMNITAHYLNMSHIQLETNFAKALNPLDKLEERQAQTLGMALDHYTGRMSRWANDSLGAGWSKTLANAATRASGLSAHLDAMRRAFAVTRYGSIGSLVGRFDSLKDLQPGDIRDFKAKGITDTDWNVWKMAKQEDWGSGNNTMLTPESIRNIPDSTLEQFGNPRDVRRNAILNLMGMVTEETHNAVITPTANERYEAVGRSVRGTLRGELGTSFGQFKAVPLAQVGRNLDRGMQLPTGAARAGYIASYVASTMLVGASVYQLKQMLLGNNPEKMTSASFWLGSFLSSGAAGVYMEALFDPDAQQSGSLTDKLLGPLMGSANDIYKIAHDGVQQIATGKNMKVGGQAVNLLKNNTPFLRAWYTRAIMDRLIFNQLQENVAPGYMNRVENRARQQGRSQWWRPNEIIPNGLPDLSKAIQ